MYIGEGQVHGHGVLSEAPRHCLLPTEDQVQWGEHHLLVQKFSFKGTVPWDLLKIWPSSMRRASSPSSKGQLILKEQCHEICLKSCQKIMSSHCPKLCYHRIFTLQYCTVHCTDVWCVCSKSCKKSSPLTHRYIFSSKFSVKYLLATLFDGLNLLYFNIYPLWREGMYVVHRDVCCS